MVKGGLDGTLKDYGKHRRSWLVPPTRAGGGGRAYNQLQLLELDLHPQLWHNPGQTPPLFVERSFLSTLFWPPAVCDFHHSRRLSHRVSYR